MYALCTHDQSLYSKVWSALVIHLLGSLLEGVPFFFLGNVWVANIRVLVSIAPAVFGRSFPFGFMPDYSLSNSSIAYLEALK